MVAAETLEEFEMFSTKEVLALLRRANPTHEITEDLLRRAIRRGQIGQPELFAGRLAWKRYEIEQLATALGLIIPTPILQQEGTR